MFCEFSGGSGKAPTSGMGQYEDDDPTWLLSPATDPAAIPPQEAIKPAPSNPLVRQGSINSISSSGSGVFSRSGSFCFTTHTVPQATVLLIDIQNFTSQCATLSAGRVGEWVAAFYEIVDAAAVAHGVTRVESRGDCCVCVCGAAGTAPPAPPTANSAAAAAAPASADGTEDQARRMLAFAAEVHARVAALPVGSGGGPDTSKSKKGSVAASTAVRMGMATGEVVFHIVVSNGTESAPCVSVQGSAAASAARIEALAAPGEARVHRSTADKWAAETRQAPPATALIELAGRAAERAAVYSLGTRTFLRCAGPSGPATGTEAAAGNAGPGRRRRLSAPF